jgi:hypothetical protein
MHVEIVDSDVTGCHHVEKILWAEGKDTIQLDATLLTYTELLNKLRRIAATCDDRIPTVLLKKCSPEHLKKLRRIRRNQGNTLASIAVYAFTEATNA